MRLLICIALSCLSMVVEAQKKKTVSYYYDLNNNKIEGKLQLGTMSGGKNPYIVFRSDSVKKTKLYANMIKSFVVGTDSFVVTPGNDPKTKFLHVVINGPTKLYAYYRQRGSPAFIDAAWGGATIGIGLESTKGYYSIGPSPDSLTPLTRKNWAEIMIKLLADEPSIVALIKDRTYIFSEMTEMMEDYNTIKKKRSGRKN